MEWFKKLNIKFKIAVGLIGMFIGMLLFMTAKRKFLAKDKLKFELARVTHESELAHLEKDAKAREKKLEVLREQKGAILRKIDVIEAQEVEIGREMSVEELDSFFDSRGF